MIASCQGTGCLRTVCFSLDGLFHCSNGFSEHGSLGCHGDNSKKSTASRGRALGTRDRCIGIWGSAIQTFSPSIQLGMRWGIARGEAAASGGGRELTRKRARKILQRVSVRGNIRGRYRWDVVLRIQLDGDNNGELLSTDKDGGRGASLWRRWWCKAVGDYVISRGT